jgi:hypothetical protein
MRKIILAMLAVIALPQVAQGQPPVAPQIQKPPIAVAVTPKGAQLTVGAVNCSGGAVSMPVSTSYTYNAGGKTKAEVYIAVNGAATERFTVSLVKGAGTSSTLSFSRTISLPTNRTDADLRIYIDGQPAGPVQTVPYSCYSIAPTPGVQVTATVTRGDVAIGPYAFAVLTPTQPLNICERRNAGVDGLTWDNFWACGAPPHAPRLQLGDRTNPTGDWSGYPGYGPAGVPGAARLFQTATPERLELGGCTQESDMQLTALFVVAIKTDRIANPAQFAGEGFWELRYSGPAPEYFPGAGYWDYRIMQTGADTRHRLFPIGYEWISFHRRLTCTRNGEMVYTFDAANGLTEDNETNNTIRIPYSTVLDQ